MEVDNESEVDAVDATSHYSKGRLHNICKAAIRNSVILYLPEHEEDTLILTQSVFEWAVSGGAYRWELKYKTQSDRLMYFILNCDSNVPPIVSKYISSIRKIIREKQNRSKKRKADDMYRGSVNEPDVNPALPTHQPPPKKRKSH